jgi:putative tryptophan/tyrosine transport system substrate-binding protein
MTDRRSFLRSAGAALAPAIAPGLAHPQGQPARIGYISFRAGPNEFEQAFLRGLRERGWVDGQNLAIDFRFAAFDRNRYQAMVTELLALQPALMVLGDGSSAQVRAQTPAMPIVVPALADAVASGVTTSLARPDGNVTGISVYATELASKRIELLKQAVPTLQRAAAFYSASGPPPKAGLQASMAAGKELGIEVVEMPVRVPEGIDAAFAAAVRQGVQGIAIISSTWMMSYRAPLCELSLKHRLPTVFANRTYLRAGGMMSYGPDLEGAFHRSAYFVDRMLKGAKPADLPIEQPNTFQLVLNQRTALALNLRFPQALLLRADEVIG